MMSDPRYKAGITQGIKLSAGVGCSFRFPWPEQIDGLGRQRVGVHSKCSRCKNWTFGMYGETPLCLDCAKETLDLV